MTETFRASIGHVHLKVRDLDRSVAFYAELLGMGVTEQVAGRYAFLSGGGLHHEIALQAVGGQASTPDPQGVGLYHSAYQVADRAAFAETYRRLRARGVDEIAVDHRISWALYFDDPDGNGVEVYWGTRHEPGGASVWEGASLPLPEGKILSA